jgi:hypothetical protein
VIGASKLPDYDLVAKGLACGFRLPLPDHISPKGIPGLNCDTMRYDKEYVPRHIGEIGVLGVPFFLLPAPVGDIW